MKVTVEITRRADIADPEGATILRALHDLGYSQVASVRTDRVIRLDVEGDDIGQVKSTVDEMCRRLLANPVLEDFEVEVAR